MCRQNVTLQIRKVLNLNSHIKNLEENKLKETERMKLIKNKDNKMDSKNDREKSMKQTARSLKA